MPSHELDNPAWCGEHQEGAGYTAQRGYDVAATQPTAEQATIQQKQDIVAGLARLNDRVQTCKVLLNINRLTVQQAADVLAKLPAPAAAPAADGLELLRRAVRGFAPTACLKAFVLLEEDGFHPAVRTYHVMLSGTDVRNAVKTQGISIEEVAQEAKRAWAKERRSTDIFRLVEECQRIVGGCLEEGFESSLVYEMQKCDATAFKTQATIWTRKAVAYAKQESDKYKQAA